MARVTRDLATIIDSVSRLSTTISVAYDDVTLAVASAETVSTRAPGLAVSLIETVGARVAVIDPLDGRTTSLVDKTWVAERDREGAVILPFCITLNP